MRGFVLREIKPILLLLCFLIVMSVSMFILLHSFYDRSAREVVESWHANEMANLQQGNILSSITKIQRTLVKSNLIRGASVSDSYGNILASIGVVSSVKISPDYTGEIIEDRLGLFSTVFTIRQNNVQLNLFTRGSSFGVISVVLVSYFLGIVFIFGWGYRRLLVRHEKLRLDGQISELRMKLAYTDAISTLARQVAHDIRSPLSALNLATMNLEHLPMPNKLLIQRSVKRITDIAEDLLSRRSVKDIGNLDSSSILIDSEEDCLLHDLILQIVSEKKVEFLKYSEVLIDTDFQESDVIRVQGVASSLARVLSNLVNNAVESLPFQRGRIFVAIHSNSDQVSIMVRDNGIGIPPGILARLGLAGETFGKKGKTSGNGLGIFYAKNVVESSGGMFHISSKLGVGTSVEMVFPIFMGAVVLG